MNTTITQRRIQPYEYIALRTMGAVRIINPNHQSWLVTRAEINAQLNRKDLDPHRRSMYEGALAALQGD